MAGGGVVAVGDSVIHGGFTRHQFIAPQSWALHLAEIGGWSFTNCARGLATSSHVVDEQLPLIVRDDFDVGAVTIGANDLQLEWDAERFEANLKRHPGAARRGGRSCGGDDGAAHLPAPAW